MNDQATTLEERLAISATEAANVGRWLALYAAKLDPAAEPATLAGAVWAAEAALIRFLKAAKQERAALAAARRGSPDCWPPGGR